MFKLRFLVAAPAALALASMACSAEVGQSPEPTESLQAASTSCPSGSKDAQQRAAASAAYSIMKAASSYCASLGSSSQSGIYGGPCFATTILTSHRYTLDSSGKTIIFDPSDVLYGNVPQAAKAALAIAQLDSSVASFLVGGLTWARANTNGLYVPVAMPIQALANFSYPGNGNSITIYDGAAGGNRRSEVVTGSPWCNTEDVHFVDTSTYESGFAPFNVIPVSDDTLQRSERQRQPLPRHRRQRHQDRLEHRRQQLAVPELRRSARALHGHDRHRSHPVHPAGGLLRRDR
jgi:hypothetical protein